MRATRRLSRWPGFSRRISSPGGIRVLQDEIERGQQRSRGHGVPAPRPTDSSYGRNRRLEYDPDLGSLHPAPSAAVGVTSVAKTTTAGASAARRRIVGAPVFRLGVAPSSRGTARPRHGTDQARINGAGPRGRWSSSPETTRERSTRPRSPRAGAVGAVPHQHVASRLEWTARDPAHAGAAHVEDGDLDGAAIGQREAQPCGAAAPARGSGIRAPGGPAPRPLRARCLPPRPGTVRRSPARRSSRRDLMGDEFEHAAREEADRRGPVVRCGASPAATALQVAPLSGENHRS